MLFVVRLLTLLFEFSLQDEKNQVLVTNVWLEHVSMNFIQFLPATVLRIVCHFSI